MIFKTITDDITGANKSIGLFGLSLQNVSDKLYEIQTRGFKDTLFNTPTIEFDERAIALYNQKIEEGTTAQKALEQASKGTNKATISLIESANGATISTEQMTAAQEASTLAAKAQSAAYKAVSIAGNMIAYALIAKGIQLAADAIDNYVNRAKYAAEAMEEAQQEIDDAQSTLKTMSDTLSENKDRFLELSQGVDKFSNNLSLSEEDYAEYLSISNQLAELFPSLVSGYDDQGNALLAIGSNADETNEKLQSLLETQQAVAQQTLIDNMDDVANGIYYEVEDAKKSISDMESELSSLQQQYKEFNIDIANSDGLIGFSDEDYSKYGKALEDALTSAGVEFKKNASAGLYETAIQLVSASPQQLETAQKFYDAWLESENEYYHASENGLKQDIDEKQNSIETSYAKMTANLQAWLKDNYNYQYLSDSASAVVDALVPEIKWDELEEPPITAYDYQNYVEENIIKPLMEVPQEHKQEIDNMFQQLLSFEDGDLDVLQFAEQLQAKLNEFGIEIDITPIIANEQETKDKLRNSIESIAEGGNSDFTTSSGIKVDADDYKKLQDYTKDFDEEQIELWNDATLGAKNATDAISKYEEALKSAQESADNLSPQWDYSETITQLDTIKDKFNTLDQAYAKLYDEDSQINFEDLSSINEAFSDLEGIDGYIQRLQESGQNTEAVTAVMQDLIGAYLSQSGVISNVTEENKNLIISFLEEMGVENAEEIVLTQLSTQTEVLALEKQFLADITDIFTQNTAGEIQSLLDEMSASDATKQALAQLALEKISVNGTTISTDSDIDNVIALANAAGASASALSTLATAKEALSSGDAQQVRWASEQLDKVSAGTFDYGYTKLNADDFKVNTKTPPSYTGGSATNKARENATKSASDTAKDTANEAEEAAKEAEEALTDALSRIQNAIDELDAEASDKFSKWSTRNDALAEEMGKVQEAIGAQQQLVDFYNSQGDATKAQEAANAVKDLQRQLKELANQKLENIKKFNEDIIALIDSLKEIKNAYIDLKEARGIAFSEADYAELISQSEGERQQYETELSQLQAQLQENIDNGYIEEGSEAWYEWQKELNGIKKSIIECQKEQVEWNKAIKQMPLEAIEKYIHAANRITNILNAQQELLEARGIGENMTDIMSHIIANTNDIGNAEGQIREYEKLIRDGFSDDVNGWAKLTEDQVNQVMYYIKNGWDEGGMNQYLAGLGIDSSRLTELDTYIQKLGEAEQSLLTAKKEQVEWNKAIQELNVTRAENYSVLIDKISTELETATNALNTRGLSEGINEYNQQIEVAKEQISGLSNQLLQQNTILFNGLTDTTNGWVKNALTNEQINKVTELIGNNDSQGLFDLLSSLGEDPGSMTELFSTIENIGELSNQIKEIENSQIELNKAILQLDVTTYENLNELLEKANTEIEGLRSLIESHGNTASDNLLSTQIENAMKAIELSKSKINSYNQYIRESFSDSVNGWASLTQEQINKIFGYMNNNDTEGLNSYFESLGLSSGTLTEFWEVVGNIRNEENNILSEMVNQEGYFNDMLDNRITQLDKIKEELQKINDAKNKALELEKARYALIEAQNNRNVMTWDAQNNQMVWTHDNDKVSNALENLNNLEFQALIDSIDDATETIQDLMEEMNLYDDNGNLMSNWKEIIASAQTSVSDIITGIISKLNERGYDIEVPKFSTGGIIKGNKGDNNLIRVADKERVLTPAQNEMFEKFVGLATDYVPQLTQMQQPDLGLWRNIPKYNVRTVDSAPVYQFNGDIIAPNVHDGDGLNVLIKDLESLPLKAQQRMNRIN